MKGSPSKPLLVQETLLHFSFGKIPNPFSAGKACKLSINPNPFFIRRGFRPLPKPLANLWQGDVIDYGDWSPSSKLLVWFTKLSPFG